MRIVFSGIPVVDKVVEKKYPHQHRSLIKVQNLYIHRWLDRYYPRVLYIDLYNLTLDGTERTSDGFHSLSDVNMMKATYVLNLMDGMSRYTYIY